MLSSIRIRLLAILLAVAIASAAGLSWYFLAQLESLGLDALEDRLAAEAILAAALLGELDPGGAAGAPGSEEALQQVLEEADGRLFSRIRVLDGAGIALADSAGPDGAGLDYSERTEVGEALAGRYGAAARIDEENRYVIYVAYPIRSEGRIVGAAYASAPTVTVMNALRDYRDRLIWALASFIVVTLLIAEFLSRWLSRPLRHLEASAHALADGDLTVRVAPGGPRETRAVGETFNTMADAVEHVVSELRNEEKRTSRFVSDVSHELRTPLTAIRGAAETLLDGEVPPYEASRFLTTIVSESERLARLASDLMTLQRIEGATGELPLSCIDLGDIARRAIEVLEPLLAERGVSVEIAGAAPMVLGDKDRLQQVLANLVDNASRVAGAGTSVRIELEERDGRAVLSVLDEGPGIAEGDLDRLFDRFYRTEPSRTRATGGSGLGLAIVKAIVTAHAGEIEVANRPEGGAQFTISLPALKE
ncbi:MAG: HAMP domain-containing protein [Clostridiales bacterium]|nr:HAMP domain-containing protein [Clostridiales bacterium]